MALLRLAFRDCVFRRRSHEPRRPLAAIEVRERAAECHRKVRSLHPPRPAPASGRLVRLVAPEGRSANGSPDPRPCPHPNRLKVRLLDLNDEDHEHSQKLDEPDHDRRRSVVTEPPYCAVVSMPEIVVPANPLEGVVALETSMVVASSSRPDTALA